MVGIIDYGMGNILSVYNAIEYIGKDPIICNKPEELKNIEKVILPGVGAFGDCIANLRQKGFVDALETEVIKNKKPILGICLGMQVMAKKSYEGGEHEGLGWFNAEVVRLQPDDFKFRIPHIGWHEIDYRNDSPLFSRLPKEPDFYFVHSYYMKCNEQADVDATCDYGGFFTAAVRKDNVFAVQFHPEKSQEYGLKVLENFLNWKS
jgi:imidazole glycerol-phosphate synthase subunit HisH